MIAARRAAIFFWHLFVNREGKFECRDELETPFRPLDYPGISNKTGTRFPAAAGGNRSTAKQKPDPAGPKAFGNKQFADVYVMFYWNNSNSVGTSITDSSAYSHDCVPAYSRMWIPNKHSLTLTLYAPSLFPKTPLSNSRIPILSFAYSRITNWIRNRRLPFCEIEYFKVQKKIETNFQDPGFGPQ